MKKEDCSIGMRGRAIAPCDRMKELVGKCGTIRDIHGSEQGIGVEFDAPFAGGHTLGGVLHGNSSRGRWCESESLELIEGMHIVIDSDGIKTNIHANINGREVDKTVRVAKEDTPNAYVGALMALNKAFGVHFGGAKAGDNVIVINPLYPNNYFLGDVVHMKNDIEGTIINNAMPVELFIAEYAVIDDISILAKSGKTRKVVCVAVDRSGSSFVVGNVYAVDPDNTISLNGRKVDVVNSPREHWLADGGNKFVLINEDGKDTD